MRAPLRRLFVAVLLTVCVGAPVLEAFDRWDHTLQDGNDSEGNLVVVVLCVGVGLITAGVVLRVRLAVMGRGLRQRSPSPLMPHADISRILPIPQASPPTILRV